MTFPLFLALTLLLGAPGLLVRGDGGGLAIIGFSSGDGSPQTANAGSNSFGKFLLGAVFGGPCKTAADCPKDGICLKKNNTCNCPVGMESVNNDCVKIKCKNDTECNGGGIFGFVCKDGGCACDTSNGFQPVENSCVKDLSPTSAPSNATSGPNPHPDEKGYNVDDTCSSLSDCHFTDAICQDKKKCVCQVGYQLDKKENKCAQTYCTKDEDCTKVEFGLNEGGIICATGNHTCMCDSKNYHLDEAQGKCVADRIPTAYWWVLAIFLVIIITIIIVAILVCCGLCVCCGCAGGSSSSKNSGTKSRQKSSSKS